MTDLGVDDGEEDEDYHGFGFEDVVEESSGRSKNVFKTGAGKKKEGGGRGSSRSAARNATKEATRILKEKVRGNTEWEENLQQFETHLEDVGLGDAIEIPFTGKIV